MATENKIPIWIKVCLSVLTASILIVGTVWAVAQSKEDIAVDKAETSLTANFMLQDHADRLRMHDEKFEKTSTKQTLLWEKNRQEHENMTKELSIHREAQGIIANAQVELKNTQQRMESSQTKFEDKISDKMDKLFEQTTKANAWIMQIDNVKKDN